MKKKQNYYSQKRVKKSFFHYLAGKGVSSVAAFTVAILLVREMAVEDFAGYVILSGFVTVIIVISGLGIERIIPKFFSELRQLNAETELRKLNSVLLVIKLATLTVLTGMFLLLSRWLFSYFDLEFSYELVYAFIAYVIFYGFSKHLITALQSLLLQKYATFGLSIEWFSKLGILMLLLFLGVELTLLNVTVIQGGGLLLSSIFMLVTLLRHFKVHSSNEGVVFSGLTPSRIINFGLINYGQTISGLNTDAAVTKIIAGVFLPVSNVAALGFAYSLVGAFKRYLPANLLLGLIEPVMMAKYKSSNDFGQMILYSGLILKLNIFFILPILVWVYQSATPLLLFITNEKYPESNLILLVLLTVLLLESYRGVLQLICNAVGESGLLLKSNLWTLSFLPLLLWATSEFLLTGLLVSILLMFAFRVLYISIVLNKRGYSFALDWAALIKIVSISVFIAISVDFVQQNVSINALSLSVISLILTMSLYLFLAFIVKPFSSGERDVLNSFLGKKLFIW